MPAEMLGEPEGIAPLGNREETAFPVLHDMIGANSVRVPAWVLQLAESCICAVCQLRK